MKKLLSLLAALCLILPLATGWAASGSTIRVQIVDERGLPVRDAVVEITSAARSSASFRFPGRAAMAQKDTQFIPGTLIVAKGSSVAFPNLDKVRHSIYSFSKAARFEIDLYGRDQTRSKSFPVSGAVSLGCHIHDNMSGYIRVVDTPYADKTDHNGYVTITGVPNGSAKITLWHPRLRYPNNETNNSVSISDGLSKKYRVKLK